MRNFNNSRRPSNGPRRDSAERGAAGSHERRGNYSGRKFDGRKFDGRRSSDDRRFTEDRNDADERRYSDRRRSDDRKFSDRKFSGRRNSDDGRSSFTKDSENRKPSYGRSFSGEGKDSRSGRNFSHRGGNPDRKYNKFNNRPERGSEEFRKPKFQNDNPVAFKPAQNEADGIRLNKYISNSGICSRREADDYIKAGLVSVNGQVVTEMGVKVSESDDVRFNGERLKGESKVYILMNKPKDVVTTVSDPHAETTVIDLIRNKCDKRVFPVGRLDKATTGVLLLTNDGDLAEKLTHPSFEKKKIYHVFLDRKFHGDDMRKLVEGITLEDGPIHVDTISYVDECKDQVGVEIHSGRNRIVRRMFEHLGYKVKKLDRVYFAGLTKRKLRRGEWRYLTEKEVSMLMMGAFE